MDIKVYSTILREIEDSAEIFNGVSLEIKEELREDFEEIVESIDINEWKGNIDGTEKDLSVLLDELRNANGSGDRQRCIESIAMIRGAVSDLESAFSNAVDSMEKLIVAIRDA